MLTTVLSFVAIIVVLIVVHELGHFLVAKWSGIWVQEFSLGFGTKLWSTQRGETQYSIRLFPIGGYVRMAGMEPDAPDDPRNFGRKPMSRRVATILAGPVMNLVLALVLFAIGFGLWGVPQPVKIPVIGQVVSGYPAAAAGLKAGDRITAIEGQPVASWPQVVKAIEQTTTKTITVSYERNGTVHQIHLVPRQDPKLHRPIIGVVQATRTVHMNPAASVGRGVQQTSGLVGFIVGSLVHSAAHGQSPPLEGVVGIASMAGQAAASGWQTLLSFVAVLSVNLGVFNLIPFPPLDGARLVFLGIEAVRRRPLKPEQEGVFHFVGFALLMLLAVYLVFHDIARLTTG